jgi:hypothetical protein
MTRKNDAFPELTDQSTYKSLELDHTIWYSGLLASAYIA